MLSRIAESLSWMSRYLERADNTARLMEINLLYLVEAEEHLSETVLWRPLLSISGSEAAFAQYYNAAEITAQNVIQFMTKGPGNPNAIHPSLRLARENARVVRDRIPKEMWQGMNELWWMVDTRLKSPLPPERAAAFYASVRNEVARFHGLTSSTMMRGEAYGFYQLGTFVERADMTARILDVKYHILLPDAAMVGSPLDYYQWAALLKSLSGFEAYRRTYHTGMRPIDVAQHTIFECDFPRSLQFIDHETALTFPSPVREHQCKLRLTPRQDATQRVHAVQIEVDPAAELFTYIDSFDNRVHHFGLIAPHDCLVTRLHAEVETLLDNPFDYTALTPSQEHVWFTDTLRFQPQLWSFVLHRSPMTPDLPSMQHGLELPRYDPHEPLLHAVQAAMDWIATTLTFQVGVTDVHSPLETVLAVRAGVCQDFAHLLIALVRSWGFPARYVMGYLDPGYIQSPDIKPTTHAWAEVLIPGAGWRGFDATLQLVTDETYVTVAVGRDDQDAAPQRGSFKGEEGSEPPQVSLQIMRQQ